MNSERRWTQTCITDLRTRLLAGETRDELADHLSRTIEDVAKMMIRLRLQSEPAPH